MDEKKIEPTTDAKIEIALEVAKKRLPALAASPGCMQKVGQAVLNLKMAKAVYAGFVNPTDELNEEISFVLAKVRSNSQAVDMQQITQAALHLMQAKAVAEESQTQQGKTSKKQTAGV